MTQAGGIDQHASGIMDEPAMSLYTTHCGDATLHPAGKFVMYMLLILDMVALKMIISKNAINHHGQSVRYSHCFVFFMSLMFDACVIDHICICACCYCKELTMLDKPFRCLFLWLPHGSSI